MFETLDMHFRVRPEPALSCAGDSGGPALIVLDGTLRVAGVASYGDPKCIETATYARLDIELDGFVKPNLEHGRAPASCALSSPDPSHGPVDLLPVFLAFAWIRISRQPFT